MTIPAGISRQSLLDWYDRHRRTLPWRAVPPHQAAPYHVWLSEMMLQQTTVATVKNYFLAFIARWPRLEDLAAAPIDEILAAWAGLGYYARARNLHRCAQMLVADYGGQFPRDEAHLRALPGIGPYTAAAIAAIAFDQPATVIDGNVDRVITRLAALDRPIRDNKPMIRGLADDLFHRIADHNHPRSGDFAQAMMDLGATICTPTKPACLSCPWHRDCAAHRQGIADKLPVKPIKKALPVRFGFHLVIMDSAHHHILVQRRPPKGLLGGMFGLPGTDWGQDWPDMTGHQIGHQIDLPIPIERQSIQITEGTVQHRFTHFDLNVKVGVVRLCDSRPLCADGWQWLDASPQGNIGLPTVFAKMVRHVLAGLS